MILYGVQNPDAVQIPSVYLWASMGCTLIMWALQLVLCFWGNQILYEVLHSPYKRVEKTGGIRTREKYSELAQKRGGVRGKCFRLYICWTIFNFQF